MVTYKGLGNSFDDPIIIEGVKNNFEGISAEYQYLNKVLGIRNKDWRLVKQSLVMKENKAFDVLEIELANGERKTYYFDITNFFGKW